VPAVTDAFEMDLGVPVNEVHSVNIDGFAHPIGLWPMCRQFLEGSRKGARHAWFLRHLGIVPQMTDTGTYRRCTSTSQAASAAPAQTIPSQNVAC
jgi:hypothetical protein